MVGRTQHQATSGSNFRYWRGFQVRRKHKRQRARRVVYPRKKPLRCLLSSRLVCLSSSSLSFFSLAANNSLPVSTEPHSFYCSSLFSLPDNSSSPHSFSLPKQHLSSLRPLDPIPFSVTHYPHSFPTIGTTSIPLQSFSVASRIYIIASRVANRSHPSETFIASE